jgi:hypothetical protein
MTFGKTGEKCLIAGNYRCFGNHNQRITMQKDEIFPKPNKHYDGIWILTQQKQNQDNNSSELFERKN